MALDFTKLLFMVIFKSLKIVSDPVLFASYEGISSVVEGAIYREAVLPSEAMAIRVSDSLSYRRVQEFGVK